MVTRITARNLDEAHFLACQVALSGPGTKQVVVQQGSMVGHVRYQLESLVLEVTHPYERPIVPLLPPGSGLTLQDANDYYVKYIIGVEKEPNEQYTYGQFIYPQLEGICTLLMETPNTNQAAIIIGEPFVHYTDPPCLRQLCWQVEWDNSLSLHSFWRSHDLYSGLPMNAAGLQLLNEFVASMTGYEPGPQYIYGSGSHVYDYCMPYVRGRRQLERTR